MGDLEKVYLELANGLCKPSKGLHIEYRLKTGNFFLFTHNEVLYFEVRVLKAEFNLPGNLGAFSKPFIPLMQFFIKVVQMFQGTISSIWAIVISSIRLLYRFLLKLSREQLPKYGICSTIDKHIMNSASHFVD